MDNYPYELHRVPGSQAIEKLIEFRRRKDGVAVILGDKYAFKMNLETMQDFSGPDLEDLLRLSQTIDAKTWLENRKNEDPEFYKTEVPSLSQPVSPPQNPVQKLPKIVRNVISHFAKWIFAKSSGFQEIDAQPPQQPMLDSPELIAHLDVMTGQPHPEIFLSVIPASESWMVPCYLRIGNWNSVPKAEEHGAMFKYWSEKHAATVACIANDVIEFTVEKPPTSWEEALELAHEHFIYCPDSVHQGTGSLERLAAMLLNSSVWYFWWD